VPRKEVRERRERLYVLEDVVERAHSSLHSSFCAFGHLERAKEISHALHALQLLVVLKEEDMAS
jgi:hypothetical protein